MTDEQKLTLAEMAERLARMEKFMTRRFDEVSAEIHATCQMLDMAESGIGEKFGEVLGALSAVTFHGDGTTPHNVGVELDSIVKTTEEAANKILSANDEIARLAASLETLEDPAARAMCLAQIKVHSDDIMMACSFQDLTGQRINKTLENIREAEDKLTDMLGKMGVDVSGAGAPKIPAVANTSTKAASQDDVDALFS